MFFSETATVAIMYNEQNVAKYEENFGKINFILGFNG